MKKNCRAFGREDSLLADRGPSCPVPIRGTTLLEARLHAQAGQAFEESRIRAGRLAYSGFFSASSL